MCDASVRFVGEDIVFNNDTRAYNADLDDVGIYQRLGIRNDGLVIDNVAEIVGPIQCRRISRDSQDRFRKPLYMICPVRTLPAVQDNHVICVPRGNRPRWLDDLLHHVTAAEPRRSGRRIGSEVGPVVFEPMAATARCNLEYSPPRQSRCPTECSVSGSWPHDFGYRPACD